jgi:hypothetical protein
MTALTNPMAQALANLIFLNDDSGLNNIGDATGIIKSTADGNWFCDLLSVWPEQAGTVAVGLPLTYTGYAQKSIPRNASDWTLTSQTIANDNDLAFGKKTDAGTETAKYWGMRRATAHATFDFIGPLALEASQPFVCDDSLQANAIIAPDHGFSDNDEVQILAVEGASLPSGLADGDIVYVITPVGDYFTVETSLGNGAENIGNGAGRLAKVLQKTIAQNDTPQIDAGDMQIVFD